MVVFRMIPPNWTDIDSVLEQGNVDNWQEADEVYAFIRSFVRLDCSRGCVWRACLLLAWCRWQVRIIGWAETVPR